MNDSSAALARLAELDEEALARPWRWRGEEIDFHYALYLALEEAQAACAQAAGGPLPESRRILALAQRAFGDLRGLLIGLDAAMLEAQPRPGEWSIGETLRHVEFVERRYAANTAYAIERSDSEPMRMPAERAPSAAAASESGDLGAHLVRLAEARAATNHRLGDVAPVAMERPSIWVRWDVDVRFRLHRFASHLVEHTVQCEKILDALGRRQAEGRRIVRRITAALGELEGLGAGDQARVIEARLGDVSHL